jgi:hypothetical protein
MGLFSSGVPTAKFSQPGDSCVGRIVAIGQKQRDEIVYDASAKAYRSTGELMFWSGGRPTAGAATDPHTGQPNQPVLDGVVTLDTGTADENGETQKKVIVKGKAELESIKQACLGAGVRDVEVGGIFKKIWVSGAGGLADPRVYEYKYKPPAAETDPTRYVSPPSGVMPAVTAQLARVHTSSPVLNRGGTTSAAQVTFEEEPPF